MKPIRFKEELPEDLNQAEHAFQTAAQLQKDFLSFSILLWDENENLPSDWMSILQRVKPIVDHLLEKDPRKLVQVFYRMDLSETLLQEALVNPVSGDSIEEISVMMIHREWLKVKWRMAYSNRSDKKTPQIGKGSLPEE
jgi:RIO-like serine/threonine protein kinase